jgi:REP element-mobilizing transposase RayT
MSDHFHTLVCPTQDHSPSSIVGSLKQRTARYIIESLKGLRTKLVSPYADEDYIA